MIRKFFVSCVILALIGFGILYLVAKTGLVRVPVFTAMAYALPTPERTVESGTAVEQEMEKQLVATLQSKLSAGTFTDADATLVFSEGTLTTSLRSAIAQGAQEVFVQDSAQVVILQSGEVELYLPFTGNEQNSALLLRVAPTAKDGGLAFDVTRVQVGQLFVPAWLQFAVQWPLDKLVSQLNDFLDAYVSVQNVTLQEGSVTLDGTMTLDLKTLIKTE